MTNRPTTRKRLVTTLLVAALAAPVAGAAVAGAMGGHGMGKGMDKTAGCERGGRHGMGENDREDRMDGRLAFLKAEIGITEAQQADWERFEQVLRENMGDSGGPGMGANPDASDLSAPDRLTRHIEHMQQRLQRMTRMQAALGELYAVLTPEQQQEADQLLPPHHGRGHGHRGGMGKPM